MAARIDLRHLEETRKKIQTSQLINRLQSHVNGECELSATQIRAAEILLRKSVPDLAAVTISGDPENPMEIVVNSARESVARELARIALRSRAEPNSGIPDGSAVH